jgi:hypothetical protein
VCAPLLFFSFFFLLFFAPPDAHDSDDGGDAMEDCRKELDGLYVFAG